MPLSDFMNFGNRAGTAKTFANEAAEPGLGSVLAGLLTDPVWGSIAAELGTGLVSGFLGLGGQSPEEQANQQRLQAAQSALPGLRRAAAGMSTASSNAITRQVRREGTGMQQSMAASARGAGFLGGTPQGGNLFRAQSDRVHAAQTEALSQRLGQHQQSAQALLMGQLQPAIQTGAGFANQESQANVYVKGVMGKLGRKYAENPDDDRINRFIDVLEKLGLGDESGGSNINTPTPGLPSLGTPGAIQNQFGFR